MHTAESDKILAIADSSAVGKLFEEDDLQLHVSEEFYGGGKCGKKEALKLIKGATIINAVGRDIIAMLVEEGLIEQNMVLHIKGVPHAQFILL